MPSSDLLLEHHLHVFPGVATTSYYVDAIKGHSHTIPRQLLQTQCVDGADFEAEVHVLSMPILAILQV